jgi:hypothetical protein
MINTFALTAAKLFVWIHRIILAKLVLLISATQRRFRENLAENSVLRQVSVIQQQVWQ